MARLLSYNNLTKISETFYGISKDAEIDRVICTLSKNMIILFQLKDQKQVKVWTFDQRPLLTCRVVYDFNLEKYVGIFGGCNLRMWDAETAVVSREKKKKLYRDVVALVESDDGRILILYKNSFCESVENAVNAPKRSPERENREIELENVEKAQIANIDGVGRFLTFFSRIDGELHLNFSQLQEEDLQPIGVFLRIKVASEHKILGYCCLEMRKRPCLLTFCGNGRLYRNFFLDSTENLDKTEPISTLNIIDAKKPLSMTAISPDLVAIYASTSSLDGAALFLFNTEYKVIQSKQIFKVFFENSHVLSFDSKVFLVAGENLSVIPFRVTKDKLADLIGSQRMLELGSKAMLESYNQNEILLEELQFDENAAGFEDMTNLKVKNTDKKQQDFHAQSETALIEDMRQVFREKVSFNLEECEDVAVAELKIKSNPCDEGRLSEPIEILVSELEQQGATEFEIVDKIVPILIDANQNGSLLVVLRRFLNISERILTIILRHGLKQNDWNIVNGVIACNFDSASILPHLRENLNFSNVKELLKHFLQVYRSPDFELQNKFENFEEFDGDTRILNWACVLLDANYQQILLAKDEEFLNLILDWRQIIKKHQKALIELESLRALVHEMVRGRYGKSSKANQWYSIEKITL